MLTKKEIDDNLTMEEYDCCGGCGACKGQKFVDSWMYGQYYYWIITNDNTNTSEYANLLIGPFGSINNAAGANRSSNLVRPLIELNKQAEITKND